MSPQNSPRVAVVGAGLSGLTLARELVKHGADVIVFEKARGSGGRAATRRVGVYRFDHGAQYFTVRDRRFAAELEGWVRDGVVRPWTGRIVELGGGGAIVEKGEPARYVGVPSMTAPARALSADLDVRYRARVRKIERNDSSWSLVLEGGEAHEDFDAIAVSAPAPQSADLLRDAAPHLAAACGAFVMQPCWSVMAAFEQPIDAEFDGAFINDRDLAWVARNSSKPGRSSASECWVLQAGPDWSRRNLERDSSEVAGELLASFFAIGGWPEQAPVHLNAHRWRFARSAQSASEGCLLDRERRVVVCGDWLCGDRVEGAFLSGWQAAQEISTVI